MVLDKMVWTMDKMVGQYGTDKMVTTFGQILIQFNSFFYISHQKSQIGERDWEKQPYRQWERDWLIDDFIRTVSFVSAPFVSVPFCPLPFCPLPFCPYTILAIPVVRTIFPIIILS